jgi:hypothetical protein
MAEFDDEVLQQGLRELQAERMRAAAEYAEAAAYNNADAGKVAAYQMDDCDARAERLVRLHQRTQPQPAPQRRPDAWMTKRSDELDYEDAYNMLNQTSENAKLGGGISREEYLQNIRRLQQEKAAGYHQR